MKNYNRFTKENTEGFCDIELSWMNFCFDSQMDFAKQSDMRNNKAYQDYLAEQILARFS